MKRLDAILGRLRRAQPTLSATFDAAALSKQIQRLLTAEDKVLGSGGCGETSTSGRGRRDGCVRVPHELWRDATPRGALFEALQTYVEWRREGKLAKDASDDDGREEFEGYFRAVREKLIERGHLGFVKIYIADDVERARELKTLARAMRATLAASADEPGVTHVLRTDDSVNDDEIEDGALWRITETRVATSSGKTEQRLHFWFYPDSYDAWYADSSISGKGKAPWAPETSVILRNKAEKRNDLPHNVRARWLRDSHTFNEWMNELDYEYDVTREMLSAPRHAWDPSNAPQNKRARAPENFEGNAEILAPGEEERVPWGFAVTRRRVVRAHPVVAAAASQDDGALVLQDDEELITKEFMIAKTLRMQNISVDQLPWNATPSMRKAERKAEPLTEYRVPTHSAWFKWGEVHAIERRALPEFFDDDDTCQKYIACRNEIMNQFRFKGQEVTLHEVSSSRTTKNIVDAAAHQRIFSFLEQWGLINWQFTSGRDVIDLKQKPLAAWRRIVTGEDGAARVEKTDPLAAFKGTLFEFSKCRATTASGLHPLEPQSRYAPSSETQLERQSLDALFASHDALSKRGVDVKFACNACGADLKSTGVFYHAFLTRDFDLCPSCFSKGVYPHGQASGDFVKAMYPDFHAEAVSADEIVDDAEWTPQEVAALLDAISQSNELNWNDIASAVGTKSEDECLKHFARMPIEDAAIENIERELLVPRGAIIDDEGAKILDPVPFAFAPNPTMAQLEFLVSMISPRVAAASAKAALTKIALGGSLDAADLNVDGLAAAAIQAKILAQDEEHEVHRIIASALDVLLKKLEIKLRFLGRLVDDEPETASRLAKLREESARNRTNDLYTRDVQSARHKEHIATIHRLRQQLAGLSS